MVDLLRPDLSAHASRHEELSGWVDHSVFFCDEVPRRLYLPSGSRSLLLDASDSDWPLCCGKKCSPFRWRVLRENGAKSLLRHPDEPMRVRCQLRCLWMRLFAIEYFGDCLAFVRCQGRYEDQRLDPLVGGRRYHRASVSVRSQNHRPIGTFQGAVERCDVIRQGRQRYWS